MADEESKDLESYIKDEISSKNEDLDDAMSLLDDDQETEENLDALDLNLKETEENLDELNQEIIDTESSSDQLINDESLTDNIKEANESIITGDPDPFDRQNFENINKTLSSIESKIDKETDQLRKLDVLEDIKKEIKKMNENNSNLSNIKKPSAGHNLPNTDDLLNRIDEIENKIQNLSDGNVNKEIQESIDNLSGNIQELKETTSEYNARFERLESSISRFEEMEKDIRLEVIDEDEDSETITAFDENNKIVAEEKIEPEKKIITPKNEDSDQKRKNILYLILLILIMTITAAVILDRLKIVDLDLDRIFKLFF